MTCHERQDGCRAVAVLRGWGPCASPRRRGKDGFISPATTAIFTAWMRRVERSSGAFAAGRPIDCLIGNERLISAWPGARRPRRCVTVSFTSPRAFWPLDGIFIHAWTPDPGEACDERRLGSSFTVQAA